MNEQKLIEWLESMPWWSKLPYAKLEEELAISMAYADKLAAGLPDGILPKDVEVLRKANHDFAEENATLKQENETMKAWMFGHGCLEGYNKVALLTAEE